MCFCCLQGKAWIKMPKWIIFEISFLWKHKFLCFHYWDYLTNFWRNNWRSIIDVVSRKTLLIGQFEIVVWNEISFHLLERIWSKKHMHEVVFYSTHIQCKRLGICHTKYWWKQIILFAPIFSLNTLYVRLYLVHYILENLSEFEL